MARLILSFGRVKVVRLVVIAVVLTITLIALLHSRHRSSKPSIYDYTEGRYTTPWRDWTNKNNATTGRSTEVNFLDHLIKKHSLTNDVTWSARVVKAHGAGANAGRPSVTDVVDKFMPKDFANARITDHDLKLPVDRTSPLKLPVAGSGKRTDVDASALLFGVSTTYSRLIYLDNTLMKEWERWLTDGNGNSNGASLLVSLQKSNRKEGDWVEERLRTAGVDAIVVLSEGAGETAYVDLVQKLKDHRVYLSVKEVGGDGKKTAKNYLALVDDDVFFPAMGKLVSRLAKFNPEEQHYIGAPCERSDWIIEGDSKKTLTYGGGAVFLTPPMVDRLTQLPCLTNPGAARTDVTGEQWDMFLYECITSHTELDLHVLPSFYNPEAEEAYGEGDRRLLNEGYASGVQPLTLHHYRNLHRFEAAKGHAVVNACGEDCFLQRFMFKDNWVLVNGYSLSHYPDGVDAQALRKEPRKLDDEVDASQQQQKVVGRRVVVVDGGPSEEEEVKVIAWAGRKRTWRLLDSRVGEGGEVWQVYVKRRQGGNWFGEGFDGPRGDNVHAEEERTDRDSVVLLIWQP
ncbi:hypothetical protein GE09DRAFT_1144962 [Coniochaeta sp. 2T2.1]|nr:hypothetical protein GE09DRAFT_1144962 [Coniochaeta sp. 2T2.1]